MARYDERARYRNGMAEDRFGDRYGREGRGPMGDYESGPERVGGWPRGRGAGRTRGRAGDELGGPARGVYGHGGFDEGGEVDESGSGRWGFSRQGWEQGDYGQQDWGPGGFDREGPGGLRPGFRGDWDRGRPGARERLSGPGFPAPARAPRSAVPRSGERTAPVGSSRERDASGQSIDRGSTPRAVPGSGAPAVTSGPDRGTPSRRAAPTTASGTGTW